MNIENMIQGNPQALVKSVNGIMVADSLQVRKSTSLRIKRRLKAAAKQYVAGNLTYERYNSTLQSYMGMMKHNDCYRFKMQLLEDVETIINESGVAA